MYRISAVGTLRIAGAEQRFITHWSVSRTNGWIGLKRLEWLHLLITCGLALICSSPLWRRIQRCTIVSPVRHKLTIGVLLFIAGVLTVPANHVAAQLIQATSNSKHLWIVQSNEDNTVVIWHRGQDDEPQVLYRALSHHGQIVPGGVASAGEWLWVVYNGNLAVQSIRVSAANPTEQITYETRLATRLPKDVTLRSFAAGTADVWALVSSSNPTVLALIDATVETIHVNNEDKLQHDSENTNNLILQDPTTPNPEPPLDHLEPDTDAIKEYSGSDRLLRLDATGWSNVRLPRNWLHGATAILVPNDDDPTQSPSIVSHHLDDRGATIRWHTHTGPSERWTAQDFPLNSSLPFRTALIDGQVVVAQPLDQTAPFTVQLMLLRHEALSALGQLVIGPDQPTGWMITPSANKYPIGILSWNPESNFTENRINWDGEKAPEEILKRTPRRPWSGNLDSLVMTATLAVATLILFLSWRRDPAWNRLELPDNLMLADLARRGLAAGIDLTPPIGICLFIFNFHIGDLRSYWPGQDAGSAQQMMPGGTMIGLFFAHTLITELFVARTLGKALLGLRVSSLTGKRPKLWQILVRNIMKVFELIAWFLLILPLIGPYRQRLGDLVGRTVVVSDASGQPNKDDG